MTQTAFIEASKEKHGDRYDYSKTIYKNTDKKVIIICPTHGEFEQTANNHTRGCGCPHCVNKTEGIVLCFLKQYENVSTQFKTPWCKNINNLPFDLCIEKLKIIVEIDGPQHFTDYTYFHKFNSYDDNHKRDLYKQKCAIENGYSVIRVVQNEIFNNKYEWKEKLIEKIYSIKKGEIYYMSVDDLYDDW